MQESTQKTDEHIGLMFGSFNPPHLCHIETAKRLKKEGGLTQVWLMPVPQSPYKSKHEQAPFDSKLEMCRILSEPYSDWIKVSDACSSFPPTVLGQLRSYKRTIEYLLSTYSNSAFSLVAGQDFSKKYAKAVKAVDCVNAFAQAVAGIPFFRLNGVESLAVRAQKANEIMSGLKVLSTERSTLQAESDDGQQEKRIEVSSSFIREAIKSSNPPPAAALPPEVYNYIVEKKLYSGLDYHRG
jgi:nicotinate-nucleotide adenylyltransferase